MQLPVKGFLHVPGRQKIENRHNDQDSYGDVGDIQYRYDTQNFAHYEIPY